MSDRHLVMVCILGLAVSASGTAVLAQQGNSEIRRTANGRPDLTGTYDTATLTPLQRPQRFGDNLFLSEEEAAAIAAQEPQALSESFGLPTARETASEVPNEAPPVGGDGSTGAAGNVGGYQLGGRIRIALPW